MNADQFLLAMVYAVSESVVLCKGCGIGWDAKSTDDPQEPCPFCGDRRKTLDLPRRALELLGEGPNDQSSDRDLPF